MAFSKGKSGNPGGRRKEKQFLDALSMEIAATDGRSLRAIASKLLEMAVSGDMQAIKEVADRLDGKPAQTVDATIEDNRTITEWTRDELVTLLHNARDGSGGTAGEDGRDTKPDSVH
jgi:hypothetical protein